MGTRECAYSECGREFEPNRHNQKFCSDDCCRRATNARLMEQYYARKARRQGQARLCANGCGTRLSRYNDGNLCGACERRKSEDARKESLKELGFITDDSK